MKVTDDNEHLQAFKEDDKGNPIYHNDIVLDFVLKVAHGGFHHKKWLIKAALNYIEDLPLNHNNEDTPNFP